MENILEIAGIKNVDDIKNDLYLTGVMLVYNLAHQGPLPTKREVEFERLVTYLRGYGKGTEDLVHAIEEKLPIQQEEQRMLETYRKIASILQDRADQIERAEPQDIAKLREKTLDEITKLIDETITDKRPLTEVLKETREYRGEYDFT